MAASDSKHTALKRSLMGLGVAVGLIVVVLLWSRCATPSTLYSGTVTVDPQQLLGPVNAVAAAERALQEWAPGSEPQLVEVSWRRSGQSVRVTADVDGATVQVLVEDHGPAGWVVPHPPRPTEGLAPSSWWPLDDPPSATATDGRWQTAVGFLDAWLTGGDTSRWAATDYRPPALAAHYPDWRITGAEPEFFPVPDTDPAVFGRHHRVRSGHPRLRHCPHLACAPGCRSGRSRPVGGHRRSPRPANRLEEGDGYDGRS